MPNDATIQLKIGDLTMRAELYDTPAAERLREILPQVLSMTRWGEEYYGNCGISMGEEPGAREEMEIGEIALWPGGSALCIFFGPTPASRGSEPRAISPVNPVGRIQGDPEQIAAQLRPLPPSITIQVLEG
ncbi:MAG: cyclophilin-like fold protein [Spirochaetota bacterium]